MRLLLLLPLFFTFFCHSQDYSAISVPVNVDGNELKYPFTGGFHAPQFSQTDFNMDGILDLFVFDRQGGVPMVFEYDGVGMSSEAYTYRPELRKIFPDSLVAWAVFRDYNHDGIGDLFVAPTFGGTSGFQLYEGSFSNGEFSYNIRRMGNPGRSEILWHQNNSGIWINLSTPFTDVPEIIDVDFDGDLDILAFELSGSFMTYYRNLQIEEGLPSDTMLFEVGDRCFGRFREAGTDSQIFISPDGSSCASRLDDEELPDTRGGGIHSGSTIMAFDNDDDNDLEIVIGDLSSNSLTYLGNGKTADFDVFTNVTPNFPRNNNPVDIPFFVSSFNVDINGDGLKDMLATTNFGGKVLDADNIAYHMNTGSPDNRFEFVQHDFLGQETIDLGSYTSPLFFDEDQDGLMDILVGTGGFFNPLDQSEAFIALYRNVGTRSAPEFVLENTDYLNLSFLNLSDFIRPALTSGDLDNDGDLDLMIGLEDGSLVYVPNNAGAGNPSQFGNLQAQYMGINVGTQARPALADLNGDGLLDLIVGEQISNANNQESDETLFGSVNYFQNIGTAENPQFDNNLAVFPNSNTLGQMHTKLFTDNFERVSSSPTIVNQNGELEIWLGDSGRIKRYGFDDDLRSQFPVIDSIVGNIDVGTRSNITLFDIDNDGYQEVLVGNARGGLQFFNTDISNQLDSVDDNIVQSDIKLFPNPTASLINIEIGDLTINRVHINSLTGQLLRSYIQVPAQMSLEDFPPGVYFLTFETETDRITKKVIKSE